MADAASIRAAPSRSGLTPDFPFGRRQGVIRATVSGRRDTLPIAIDWPAERNSAVRGRRSQTLFAECRAKPGQTHVHSSIRRNSGTNPDYSWHVTGRDRKGLDSNHLTTP